MMETVPSGTILHGRYRIERVLGSGGFGHVYLAIDQNTQQQYAIKEYLVTGQSGQEQLKHEATVLSHLHHPNLPAYQDAFIERGRYYMVSNYIEGNDLTDIIRMARQRNEVVPITQITNWILSICDAVNFLHNQQPTVIHRDIKPDNIRIMPNGTAVLVDLGNAKAAADGARTLFFIRHQGTPGYAPPEQYPGGSGTDARSDIYALGGTLYFALTAHEPSSVSARNQAIQQRQSDLPNLQEVLANNPPENADARQFRLNARPGKPILRHSRHVAQLGNLPSESLNQLNYIIQRSMAMKPKDRYQYVIELANDLKTVIATLPTPSSTSSRPADPNSTQPDLPMLYEALQAAKENVAVSDPHTTSSANRPSAPPNAQDICPRCGATLIPKAAFCPQCGTALKPPNQSQTSNPGNVAKDISAEKTLLATIQPQALQNQLQIMQQAPATRAPNTSVRPANNVPVNTPQNLNEVLPTHHAKPALQAGPGQQQPPTTRSSRTTTTQANSQPSFGLSMNVKLILLLIIIAIALAVMVVIIMMNHGMR